MLSSSAAEAVHAVEVVMGAAGDLAKKKTLASQACLAQRTL